MAQTASLIKTLKKALRSQGKTYMDVADAFKFVRTEYQAYVCATAYHFKTTG